MKYKLDKEKCMSCGSCISMCPACFKMGEDGRAEVIDVEKGEECQCNVKNICPFDAISALADEDVVLE